MHPRSRVPSVVPWLLATVLLAGCTNGAQEPAPTTPAPGPTSPSVVATSPSVAPVSPSPSAAPAPPSPTPAATPSGTGSVHVAAADGSATDLPVGGDCMLSGPTLPEGLAGDALVDDVEVLIGVDSYVGPLGQPVDAELFVLEVDGEADDATVAIWGGPVDAWRWWAGSLGTLELSDPVDVAGTTRVSALLTARLERIPADRLAVPAPRPSPSPAPTSPPATAATPSPGPVAAADLGPVASPVVFAQPASPSSSPEPVLALDLTLDVECTVVP